MTSFDVRSVAPSADIEDVLALQADPGGKPDRTGAAPAAVVLELECSNRTKTILERVSANAPSVPTIVAPPTGSEALATAALRADADEYVRSDEDDPVERIVETIQTARSTERDSNHAAEPEPIPRSGNPDQHPSPRGSVRRDRSRDRRSREQSSRDRRAEDDRPTSNATTGSFHRILATELPDEAFVIGADGTYFEAKVRSEAADLYSTPAEELPGTRLEDVFPDDVAVELQACIDRTLRTGDVQSIEYEADTSDGRRRYEARVVPIDERIEGQRAVVWLARDITERANRERKLQSRRDQLETLIRISSVIGRVIQTIVEAPSREEIERDVCQQLVDSELYCGAWIAERTGEGTLSYRTGAGDAERYLERIPDQTVDDDCLVLRAVRTGEIQSETDLATCDRMAEPLREAARADGIRSVIAVPISHNESIYGVLTVLAGREEAFGEGERAGFELLAETIGFTIMAVKNRQLLFSDTVVELEFRIDGGDTFSFDLSEAHDCTCSLEWAGTTAGGRTVQYVTIDGLDGETVVDEADSHDSIERCRLIHDGGDRCTIEMRLSKSGVRALANHGATIRDVTVENGVGTCLVEVSQDADVRKIAEALTVVYENTELVARRRVDRPVRTAAERRSGILDQLTDRQLTTLRLAYYGGFFDWPRESTGEEIASAMDVSAPTMHQHLRKGLKTILCEFFDGDDGPDGVG